MKELLIRHYQAIVSRGLITDKTDFVDFSVKINEEKGELSTELLILQKNKPSNWKQEAIDLICVVTNMLQHNNVDIELELIKNIEVQEKRAKKL